ncbi:MAG: ATP-dependent helicase [Vampirovibrionales bacterium]|nr:ATP-dependent helicase [Vampirovibrionales bacterium]
MPLLETPNLAYDQRMARLNPEQRCAVEAPIEGLLQIVAGAGTGKTEVMAARIARIAQTLSQRGEPRPLQRILAMSFTHKASRELLERVQRYLPDTPSRLTPQEASYDDSNPPWITTIHGACIRLLKEQPEALLRAQTGLSKNFKVIGDLEQSQLFEQLIEHMSNDTYDDITSALHAVDLSGLIDSKMLTLQKLQALPTDNLEALLEILPAVVKRIKSAGLSPKHFFKIAKQQAVALDEVLAGLPVTHPHDGSALASPENLCAAWALKLKPWGDPRWVAACQDPYLDKAFYKEHIKPLLESKLYVAYDRKQKAYLPVAPEAHDTLQIQQAIERISSAELQMIHLVAAFYARYQTALKEQNIADYDDLILHAKSLLEQHPDIQQRYQRQFQAVLVDEFQDTNNAQLTLLRLLIQAERPNLTVVGDTKQSIYGFRFAQAENLSLITDGIAPEHLYQMALTTNYRSESSILETANRLAVSISPKDNPLTTGAVFQDLGNPDYPRVQFEVVYPDSNELVATPEADISEFQRDSEDSASIDALRAIEIQRIVTLVQHWQASGLFQPSEIAILTRSRSKVSAITRALEAAGIAVSLQAESGFFQRPSVKRWVAVLRLIHSPHDDLGMIGLLQTRLNARQLMKIARNVPRNTSWFSALSSGEGIPDDFSQPLKRALACVCELVAQSTFLPISEQGVSPNAVLNAYKTFMSPLGLWPLPSPPQGDGQERLGTDSGQPAPNHDPESETRLWRTWQTLLKTLTQTPTVQKAKKSAQVWAALLAFVERLQADPNARLPQPGDEAYPQSQEDEQSKEIPAKPSGVQVMTAFSAKGLEFPAVIVAWVESKQGGGRHDHTLLQYDPCLGEFPVDKPVKDLKNTMHPGYGLILGALPEGYPKVVKSGLHRVAWKKPRAQAERDRLFYVALTRAKACLYVLGPEHDETFMTCGLTRANALPKKGSKIQETVETATSIR